MMNKEGAVIDVYWQLMWGYIIGCSNWEIPDFMIIKKLFYASLVDSNVTYKIKHESWTIVQSSWNDYMYIYLEPYNTK